MIINATPPQVPMVQTKQTIAAATRTVDANGPAVQAIVQDATLRSLIDGSIRDNEAQQIMTGVQIYDSQGQYLIVDHNADTEHFAASINKVPVTWPVLQDLRNGKLSLDQTMTWTADDVRGGNGVYDQPGAAKSATLRDVLFDMLNRSGNTAVRVIVNQALGGPNMVNNRWNWSGQLPHTYLQPLDATHFYLGNTCARDALWVMGQMTSIDDQYFQFVKHAMATNIYNDFGVRSQLAGNDWIVLMNKVGILDDPSGNNRHDVGIIFNTQTQRSYGYSFMTTSSGASTTRADQSLKDMGKSTLQHAGDTAGATSNQIKPFSMPSYAPDKKIVY